jgi:hypothetical protein
LKRKQKEDELKYKKCQKERYRKEVNNTKPKTEES